MKTELSLSGFREIPAVEQQEINGGFGGLGIALLAAVIGAVAEALIDDWDNLKNGLQGLPEEKN